MSLVNFANLDFDQIKTTIKDYLRSNSNFTDYDFEGSNLSTIIDVLAYNTYITSYNANMVSNEVFIDSATLRENVVSLARNVGYLPRSKKASQANVSFFVDTSDYSSVPQTITLNKGIVASTGRFNGESYTYAILDDITVPVVNSEAVFEDVVIFEGIYITKTFTVTSFDPNQRFILPNAGIDLRTVRVTVKPSENSTVTQKYREAQSLFELDNSSAVYFVNEIEGERYELIFGDGIFGKKLEPPNFIEVSYLVTSGSDSNGNNSFDFSGRLTSTRDGVVIDSGISLLTTLRASSDGDSIEDIESIKKFATRIYASQKRAVTPADYEAIIPSLYAETDSVSAFGGEDLNPPQFGRVFVTIKPTNGPYLSNLIKDNIKRELSKYKVAGISLDIIDLKYLYVEINTTVYYNPNLAKSASDIITTVSDNILLYAKSTELNTFGGRFKYSKFVCMIDDSDPAITSNITTVTIRRDLRVALNNLAEYEICYGNRFFIGKQNGYNVKSSGFSVSGIAGIVYLTDIPDGNGETGKMVLIQLDSATQAKIVRQPVGEVDYIRGEIKLSPINITSTVINKGFPIIELSTVPYSNDVVGLHDLFLQIDTNYTVINAVDDQIASGIDVAGVNFEGASSYANGSLVRGPVLPVISAAGATVSATSTPTSTVISDTTTTTTTTTSLLDGLAVSTATAASTSSSGGGTMTGGGGSSSGGGSGGGGGYGGY